MTSGHCRSFHQSADLSPVQFCVRSIDMVGNLNQLDDTVLLAHDKIHFKSVVFLQIEYTLILPVYSS